ncbi:MAG: carbamoyltransferase HypF [Actinomycetota bacterium]|nr:carbamoyltransferase HypF [Actinomycetota bacterium]
MTVGAEPTVGVRIRVRGTVQGVGFRPFVYRHARALGLLGYVRNDSAGVLIEAEGSVAAVDELCRLLAQEPPRLAVVSSIEVSPITGSELSGRAFSIEASDGVADPDAPVSVDTATCEDCLGEMGDPSDRRYRYPFTNCTNCGPRYTIVLSVPYDRPATTMATFEMCPLCRHEYEDPGDRRFHAQPNACPACGPMLSFHDASGDVRARGAEALDSAIEKLRGGAILAVKGLGGFHLAVDATDSAAVAELRRRKARDDKPFAVMVRDLAAAEGLAELDSMAAEALTSHRRPIVLSPRLAAVGRLAEGVAPGLSEIGLLLPYTPLHHLLLEGVGRSLVMTSANRSDEPIAQRNGEVFDRLGDLVDGVVSHDRDIHIRCDDSVARSAGGRIQMVRRSRGYAPAPLRLVRPATEHVLAVGAELKSTVTVAKGDLVVASHHLGDLEHLATYQAFRQAVGHLCDLYAVTPAVVAHDLHPEYLSTKFAHDLGLPTCEVQHHHAHLAACLTEHAHAGPVLGMVFDGLGMGPDGVLWGGELLVGDLAGYRRAGHLRTASLPGGSAAIREPWRMALSWVHRSLGPDAAARLGPQLDDRWAAVLSLVETGPGGSHQGRGSVPVTTSMGRLFDAVAALVGVRRRITYEGQAAIELEALARRVPRGRAPHYPVELRNEDGGVILDPGPLVAAVVAEMDRGVPADILASGFHESLGAAAAAAAAAVASDEGLDTVALTGGVFQNARLTEVVVTDLVRRGLQVLVHESLPPNDGSISIGQAAVAAAHQGLPTVAPDL